MPKRLQRQRFSTLRALMFLGLLSVGANGCASWQKDRGQTEAAPPVQTIMLQTGVNQVKLVDQRAQREIEIAWNSDELGKLEKNQITPEIVRLPAKAMNGETAPAPLTVVVTHREPERFNRSEAVHIRQITVKDAKGFFVNLGNDGQYHVKPGEKVRLEIELDNPSQQSLTIEAFPRAGRMEPNTTYIAPNRPGETDQIKIKVFNTRIGSLMDMEMITIKIVDIP